MDTIEEISKNTDILKTNQERIFYLASLLDKLTKFHQENCEPYRKFVQSFFESYQPINCIDQIPFIPIGLFKELELISVPRSKIVRVLQSSGTSGIASKVYLDKATAINQIKALTDIFHRNVYSEKVPMIVIDFPQKSFQTGAMSARNAAVKGFSIFASQIEYLLDENSELQVDLLGQIQEKYGSSEVFFFGFTFVIWKEFLSKLKEQGLEFNFPKASLIHGGGWKKLNDLEVSDEEFKASIKVSLGIDRVLNYYGMTEQTGSLYFECQESNLHTTAFGYVVIRDFKDFSVCAIGEIGIVQILSVIPSSYPGHSILTEDIGRVIGDDGCMCNKPGRYFKIIGRLPQAEIRGCSDVYGNA